MTVKKKMVTLNPGESKTVTFEFIPQEPKTYQVIVDGLSGSFNAVPLPGVIAGLLLVGWIWWEGLSSWKQITSGNQWAASAAAITRIKVRNTGNVSATFQVGFFGMSNSITLVPGESGFVEGSFTIPTVPGTSDVIVYADGRVVDSFTIRWEVY